MTDATKFDCQLYDLTDIQSVTNFGESDFTRNIETLLSDIKWQIDRESSQAPRTGPILQIDGHTVTPNFRRLWNGAADRDECPASDHITKDFSSAAQFDKLLDISTRFVAAAMEGRTEEKTRLIWRSSPAIELHRYLTPIGLLLTIHGSVAWV